MTVDLEATETTIPALLEQVANGDEVRLLKNGVAVAVVMPRSSASSTDKAQAAMDRMTERARKLGLKFDFDEFKEAKESGRR